MFAVEGYRGSRRRREPCRRCSLGHTTGRVPLVPHAVSLRGETEPVVRRPCDPNSTPPSTSSAPLSHHRTFASVVTRLWPCFGVGEASLRKLVVRRKGTSAEYDSNERKFAAQIESLVRLLSRRLLWRGRRHRVFAFDVSHSAILVLHRGVHALTPNPLQLSSPARERPSACDALNPTLRLSVFHNGPMEAEVELIAVVRIADISLSRLSRGRFAMS